CRKPSPRPTARYTARSYRLVAAALRGMPRAVARVVGADDPRHQRMAHDVLLGKAHDRDIVEASQSLERVRKPRASTGRQIDLAWIPGHDHTRAFAEPGQKHLHLHRC